MQRQWAGWDESVIRNHLPLHSASIFECQALEHSKQKTKRSLAFTSYWGWEIDTDKKQETSTSYWWKILRKKRKKKKSKWPVLVSSPRAVLWVGGSRHFTIPNRHPLKQFHPTRSQMLSRKTSIKTGSLLGRPMRTWSENPEMGSQLC